MASLYLLCIDPPYQHARHYLGYASKLGRRILEHRAGHGSKLTSAAVAAGSELILVRTWPNGTRAMERTVKNRGDTKRKRGSSHLRDRCPRCQGKPIRGYIRAIERRLKGGI